MMKLSFVDVSPSTVAPLNDTSATSRAICDRSAAATGASVAMKTSIVAMSGWIIPAPLAMPVTVTGTPPTLTRREAALGTVSVVMMALAAANQPSARAAARAAGNPRMILSVGSGSMITPVENGSTSSGAQSMSRATATHSARASAKPRSPVPAFALPALTTSARKSLTAACCRARCSRHTVTGAAQKRFCVNTPAATVPRLAQDEQHVVASPVLDRRGRRAQSDARHGQQRIGGGRRVVDGHRERILPQPASVPCEESPQIRPWQCLYFLPEPHGHRSLRPTFSPARVNGGGASATSPSGAAASASSYPA